MANQQTGNYQLSQWAKTDRILMEDFNSDNQKIDAALTQLVPSGVILLWSGATDAIPTGFALCDGNNGTPDLRDRFIMGGGGTAAVGSTGGAAEETLTKYSHTGGTVLDYLYASSNATRNNLPPYYTLCYIMKL